MQINGFGAVMFSYGNFTTILAIALDRYLTVCWSSRFPPTKRRAIALVVFCWAYPIINVIPPTFEFLSDFKYHPDTHHCSPAWEACLYYIITFTFIFGITVPVMAFCYFSVIITIRRQELRLRSHASLKGNMSSALNTGTTSDSGIVNISMDTVSIRSRDDLSDSTNVIGTSDCATTSKFRPDKVSGITGVIIGSTNKPPNDTQSSSDQGAAPVNTASTNIGEIPVKRIALDVEDGTSRAMRFTWISPIFVDAVLTGAAPW